MALALGVAAMFFGVAFIIVGAKGGGVDAMNKNIVGMMKGEYLPENNPGQTSAFDTFKPTPSKGATSTTGGANSSGKK